jgi:hypothetical protein
VANADHIELDPNGESALRQAASWARRLLMTRKAFRASVISHEARIENYERVLYSIEKRRLALRTAPGRNGRLGEPPDPSSVDPWLANPTSVEADTRTVTTCGRCGGSGQCHCSECGGSTRASCPYCFGGSTIARQKGRLLKQCPHCRGTGTRKCTSCRGGLVPCPTCGASGYLTAWLEMEREFRKKVCVLANNAAVSVHSGVDDPADFDRGSWRNHLIEDTGMQRPSSVPDELGRSLDPRADRVLEQRCQAFSGTVHRFCFDAVLGKGFVDLAGEPPAVSSTSRWAGLKVRLYLMAVVFILGGVAANAAYGAYVGRHAWFTIYGNGHLVAALLLIASLLASCTLGSVLLVRRGRSLPLLGGTLAGTIAFLGGAYFAFGLRSPQASVARAALASGQVLRAQDEAQALVDTGADVLAGGQVLDEIHVRQAKATQSRQELALLLRERWFSPKRKEEAVAELQHAVERDASAFFRAHDAASLERLTGDGVQVGQGLGEGALILASALRAVEFLATWNAKAARDALGKLAPPSTVPSTIRPPNWDDITAGASRVIAAIDGMGVKGLRARRKALAEAVEASRAYAAALGTDPDAAAKDVSQQLEAVQTQLARAIRRKNAADRKADSENPSEGERDSSLYPAMLGDRSNSRSRPARQKAVGPVE